MKAAGCVRIAVAFAYERVKTHKKIIYELAFHSFTTDMALPFADSFLEEDYCWILQAVDFSFHPPLKFCFPSFHRG
jgi:hypothetical protein